MENAPSLRDVDASRDSVRLALLPIIPKKEPIMPDAAHIVYLSPAGTTRHVAEVIGAALADAGVNATQWDLAGHSAEDVHREIAAPGTPPLLFIGSPVYVNHAVPPVTDFINGLPKAEGGLAVPFVTYGAVSSGIALYRMTESLQERGYAVPGAAKVVAVHSSLWRMEHPLGEGHPDAADDAAVRGLVAGVLEKAKTPAHSGLPLSALAYQPPETHAEMENMSLAAAAGHLPEKKLDAEACTECGICAENCPTDAIALAPLPEFGDACIFCFRCVRDCPESAIHVNTEPIEERVPKMAAMRNETPPTQMFL